MAERKSRQLTPAKFDSAISEPNLSSASFTRKPQEFSQAIKNDSAAINRLGNLISGAIDTGATAITDFKEGFAVKELELQQQQNIQDFLDSRDPNKVISEELKQAADFNDQEKAFTGVGTAFATPASSSVEKQHFKLLGKLESARRQGKIGATEFANRALAFTKAAVNKNPGFAPQLLAISRRTLDLSGVQSIIDIEGDQAKAAAKREAVVDANLTAIAKEAGIPMVRNADNTVNKEVMKPIIDAFQKRKGDALAVKTELDKNTNEAKLNVIKMASKPEFRISAINGFYDEAVKGADNAMANADGGNLSQRLEASQQILTTAYTEFLESAEDVISDPNVEKAAKYYKGLLDAYQTSLTKGRNLEESVKRANGLKQIMESKYYIDFHTKYNINPFQTRFMTSIMDNFQGPFLNEPSGKGVKVVTNYQDILTDMLYDMGSPDEQNDLGVETREGKSFAAETQKQAIITREEDIAAKAEGVNISDEQLETNDTMVNNVTTSIMKMFGDPKDLTPEQLYAAKGKIVTSLSTADMEARLPKLTEVSAANNITLVDQYVKQTLAGKDGHDFINTIRQFKAADPSMQIGFFIDGKLSFRSVQFPVAAQALTVKYGTRISQAARVSALITGGAINKGTIETFYSDYPDLKTVLEEAGVEFRDKLVAQTPEDRERNKSVGGEIKEAPKVDIPPEPVPQVQVAPQEDVVSEELQAERDVKRTKVLKEELKAQPNNQALKEEIEFGKTGKVPAYVKKLKNLAGDELSPDDIRVVLAAASLRGEEGKPRTKTELKRDIKEIKNELAGQGVSDIKSPKVKKILEEELKRLEEKLNG